MYVAISADCSDNNISKINIVTLKIKKNYHYIFMVSLTKEKTIFKFASYSQNVVMIKVPRKRWQQCFYFRVIQKDTLIKFLSPQVIILLIKLFFDNVIFFIKIALSK